MMRDYIYFVNDPDGDIYVFRDITTAWRYVAKMLMESGEVLNAYGNKVKDDALYNPDTIPVSYTDFVNNLVINGNIDDYDYHIITKVVLTEKDI